VDYYIIIIYFKIKKLLTRIELNKKYNFRIKPLQYKSLTEGFPITWEKYGKSYIKVSLFLEVIV